MAIKLTPANLIGDLVERMTLAPAHCMFCGQGNVADSEGEIGPFINTRLDRAWGDSCYICPPCGMQVGALFDMVGPDEIAAERRAVRQRDKKIHDLEAQLQQRARDHRVTKQRLDAALTTKKELARRRTAKKERAA